MYRDWIIKVLSTLRLFLQIQCIGYLKTEGLQNDIWRMGAISETGDC